MTRPLYLPQNKALVPTVPSSGTVPCTRESNGTVPPLIYKGGTGTSVLVPRRARCAVQGYQYQSYGKTQNHPPRTGNGVVAINPAGNAKEPE